MMHDVPRMHSKSTARFEKLIYGANDSHHELYWCIRQTK